MQIIGYMMKMKKMIKKLKYRCKKNKQNLILKIILNNKSYKIWNLIMIRTNRLNKIKFFIELTNLYKLYFQILY